MNDARPRNDAEPRLLGPDEPSPVEVVRPGARSPWLLTCDHAGRLLPGALGDLGLPESELVRHIAWDIGIAAVSTRLSAILDAAMVGQRYSRLVIDCNRPPSAPTSIPRVSESTTIPGNLNLSDDDRDARVAEVFRPYHDQIEAVLNARSDRGAPTILVAMHSFTPVYKGEARRWHVGTLYGRDGRLARALFQLLSAEGELTVGDNEPYSVSDETDYGIPVHAERRGLLHVGIEIRQDLIGDEDGQAEWAERLGRLLPQAAEIANR